MSLNDILGSAMSGLAASQAGLRTVSNNIANVGTPGYARESTAQTTAVTGGVVTGVKIGEPSRIADRFLETNVYQRAGDMGAAEVTSTYLDRLQGLLGAPGAESGLPARLDAISAAAVAMTGAQASPSTVANFTTNVQDAITSMNQLRTDAAGLRADVESEVGYSIDRINTLLVRINDLNENVARLDGNGRSSAGVADQRMSAIEELSGLVKITVRDQPSGRVTIDTASGTPLLDNRLRQLSYPTSGQSSPDQLVYPVIDLRFADKTGKMGAATGDKLDSAAMGGKLGGLLDLRDRALPDFTDKLGTLFTGLSETLNAASNAGTTAPAPAQLDGRQTGLVGADRLGFTGAVVFAVTKANGELVAKTTVDFSALGAGATINDAIAAINTGLGGSGIATFTGGVLTIKANGTGNGIAIAQDPAAPSARAGVGFSQYFGMNDLIRSTGSPLVPTGFVAADPHGFASGQAVDIVLRDSTGRALKSYSMTGSVGPTFGDLVTELNASPIGSFGTFAMDDRGRIQFQGNANVSGATLTIVGDTTDRLGTGRSFSSISQMTGTSSGLATAGVRGDIRKSASKLGLAQLQTGAAVGTKAIGTGDNRGATRFVDQLETALDLGNAGITTTTALTANFLGSTGASASHAAATFTDAAARRDDAVNRRDSYSGVNIDEELAQMVVLQNSYSAAARVISTAGQMYDTLLAMVR